MTKSPSPRNPLAKSKSSDEVWKERLARDSAVIDEWEQRMSDEGMPEELPQIPRPWHPAVPSGWFSLAAGYPTFEDNTHTLENSNPAVIVSTQEAYFAKAQSIFQDKGITMSPLEQEIWEMFCAGVSARQIASQVGCSRAWLHDNVLGPLKKRAGLPIRNYRPVPPPGFRARKTFDV